MLMNEELDRRSSREVEVRKSARETLDTYFGRCYHQVVNSSSVTTQVLSIEQKRNLV